MIDYSKLQIEIVKNYCKGKKIINFYSIGNGYVILTDPYGDMFIKIPSDKFILDVNKFVKRESKNFEDLFITTDKAEILTDTLLSRFSKSFNKTYRVFIYQEKYFYIDEKLLEIIGYNPSTYRVEYDINKKYLFLLFYIDDKLIGGIAPAIL